MIPTNRYNRIQQQQRSRKSILPNNHGSFFKIAVCLVIGLVLGGTISLLCFLTLGNADEMFGEQVSVAHAVLQRSSSTVPRIDEMEATSQQQHYNIRGGGVDEKKDSTSILVKEQPAPRWKRAAAAAISEKKKQRTIPFQRKKDQKNKDATISVEQVIDFLSNYLHLLHEKMAMFKDTKTHVDIWEAFYEITKTTLYPWDLEYLQTMPSRRQDGSIFLSLASYRDENCVNTLSGAFENAKHPSQLFVGLVQQNCFENCQSGVLEGGKVMDVQPDVDCHAQFCDSDIGKPHCEAGRVRVLFMEESESLGPYMARYFASKLWSGEEWFLQIDAHMSFAQNWDADTIVMLQAAPSNKPVISHYPPDEDTDFSKAKKMPAPRICVPEFADSGIEEDIVRLEGSGVYDHERIDTPRFAPFVAAGYFAAHSDFLKEVPFDPFLPWIFMGEEIIMSARLWTSGYDIFSPTHSVLGHIYIRRHKPKFWESVGRLFQPGIHNPLQRLVLQRVKTQLLYPESQPQLLKTKSLLFALDKYTMGKERSLQDYLEMVGLDPKTKKVTNTKWCQQGMPPNQFQHLQHLYQKKQPETLKQFNVPHKNKAVAEQRGNEKDKTANKNGADHDDPEGKDGIVAAANGNMQEAKDDTEMQEENAVVAAADGNVQEAKDDTEMQEENAKEKEVGGDKAGDMDEGNKYASEPSDDDDDTEEKQEEKQSGNEEEQAKDGDVQASDTDKDAKGPTGDDDDDTEEQSDAKEENVVGDTEEQANEQDGQASDTEEQAKEQDSQASDTEEGDEDAEEPTGDDNEEEAQPNAKGENVFPDTEEQAKEEEAQASDTEEQAKEEDGQASDTEEQAKEEDVQASDTEEQAKEEDGQASDTEEQAKEEDGQGSDTEEQAEEEDGQGSDTEEQAEEEDGQASDTEEQAKEEDEQASDAEEQAKQGDGGVDEEEGGGNDTEGSKDGEPDPEEEETGDDNDTDQEAGAGDDDAEGQEEGGDDDAEGQEEQEKAADVEAKPEAIERRALLKNRVKLEVDD